MSGRTTHGTMGVQEVSTSPRGRLLRMLGQRTMDVGWDLGSRPQGKPFSTRHRRNDRWIKAGTAVLAECSRQEEWVRRQSHVMLGGTKLSISDGWEPRAHSSPTERYGLRRMVHRLTRGNRMWGEEAARRVPPPHPRRQSTSSNASRNRGAGACVMIRQHQQKSRLISQGARQIRGAGACEQRSHHR